MSFSVYINNKQVSVDANMSILQACEIANVIIPRFCYHERLSVAGNCRMCLVEVEKMPKLQASCAVPVSPNMVIKTDTLAVKKAREGVLEFLLVNHPLDCPICDQGGECDLQDQSMIYGSDRSRFKDSKRAVEDKNCGPLIKTVMTRCIHCTRCVRFANEIAGVPDLGTSGRGNLIEIGTYIEKMFASELSGNVIDLCPVGALTSKPYAFLARPWELKSTESIDVFDSILSNIRVDSRGYEIMRILPRLNENINDEWITDKVRFSFDGLTKQRLNKPLIKDKNTFKDINWSDAINLISEKINVIKTPQKLALSFGPFVDFDTLVYAKMLVNKYNGKVFSELSENSLSIDFQNSYKFNTSLKNLSKSDLCLVIGANPKTEGAILNYHLRKRYLNGNLNVAYIGSHLNFSFPAMHLGLNLNQLVSIIEGKHFICKYFKNSKNPTVIIGKSLINNLKNNNVKILLNYLKKNTKIVTNDWNGFNLFNVKASDFCRYDLGLIDKSSDYSENAFDVLYVLGNSKLNNNIVNAQFTIYQDHHGCAFAQKADIILPICSFMEKPSIYGNIEGRFQVTQAASIPLGSSKEAWKIVYAVFNNNLERYTDNISVSDIDYQAYNFLPPINQFINKQNNNFFKYDQFAFNFMYANNSFIYSGIFDNFYKTDIISESSAIMAKCSAQLVNKKPFKM